jgi:hypothetical protein
MDNRNAARGHGSRTVECGQSIDPSGILGISLDHSISVFFSGRALETKTLAGLSSRSWNR